MHDVPRQPPHCSSAIGRTDITRLYSMHRKCASTRDGGDQREANGRKIIEILIAAVELLNRTF